MSQKINPPGLRLGVNRDWEAKWFADKDYKETLNGDLCARDFVAKKLKDASVSTVETECAADRINISIHAAKPGMVVGKGGSEVKALRKQLNALTEKQVHTNTIEIKRPDLDAKLVGDSAARQLEARVALRCATRQVTQRAIRADAKGIRAQTAGRLNDVNMARREWHTESSVPLHTLRTDIDYARVQALTTYGQIGVRVWINRNEILPGRKNRPASRRPKGGNK